VRVVSLGPAFTARAAAEAARDVAGPAVYLANFENHPHAIETLAAGRELWGNGADVVIRVRDPSVLAASIRRRGYATPQVRLRPDTTWEPGADEREPRAVSAADARAARWLLKPLASGGGLRMRMWQPGMRVPRRCYLQEFIEGVPRSMVFVAAGGRAVPIGLSRQLVGERAFGVSGFEYCGNIFEAPGEGDQALEEALFEQTSALAAAVAEEFGLAGVNGIDFVSRNGTPYLIEVNPRWSASMELVEGSYALSVFGVHAAACRDGVLPAFDLRRAREGAGAVGKAVVYAQRDTIIGDSRAWLARDGDIRDVPKPRERIGRGKPICTVFAAAGSSAACHDALIAKADRIYEQLAAWDRDRTKIV
jgi:predicted ATP-grasp superfamily ATP-dependent carboligase